MSNTNAQISPLNAPLGIYGTVPDGPNRENVHYVYLISEPALDGSPDHFLPVNGLKNFNFYYLPDGTGFIPAGGYRVWYFGANKTTSYGFDDVNYTPNAGYTDGEEVRPFYVPDPEPKLPLGVHGVVRGYNAEGQIVDLPGLQVTAYRNINGVLREGKAKTNGDGFFSVYYGTVGTTSGFLEASPHPTILITTPEEIGGCTYFLLDTSGNTIYDPVTGSGANYFVSGASAPLGGVGTVVLPCT